MHLTYFVYYYLAHLVFLVHQYLTEHFVVGQFCTDPGSDRIRIQNIISIVKLFIGFTEWKCFKALSVCAQAAPAEVEEGEENLEESGEVMC